MLLTTHYMDEAERLCDRVAVVDHGKVIAQGSPRELIASLGGEHILDFSLMNSNGDAIAASSSLMDLPAVRSVREEDGDLFARRYRASYRSARSARPAAADESGTFESHNAACQPGGRLCDTDGPASERGFANGMKNSPDRSTHTRAPSRVLP